MNIVQYPLPLGQYILEEYQKKQIYLHHTAGNSNPYATVDFFKSTPDRVATSFVIGGINKDITDGEIVQCFPYKYWAYHLGLKQKHFNDENVKYQQLDKISVGIEITNWGPLTLTEKGWQTYTKNTYLKDSEVITYEHPFKGYKHYHKYTDGQINSLYELLKFLSKELHIDPTYKGDKIFSIDKRALLGEPGIYTHVSVRPDKSDCHPQPELINMLKSL